MIFPIIGKCSRSTRHTEGPTEVERLHFSNKRLFILFAVLFCLGIITCPIPTRDFVPHHMPALFYCTLIILWGNAVRRRILDPQVRHRILTACVFMVFLFLFRMCKYSFFPGLDHVEQVLWYAYYIPMTAIPLFFFMAAARMEPVRHRQITDAAERILVAVMVILDCVVLTNNQHGLVFHIIEPPGKKYTHEWFYYVILVWMILFGLGTVVILFRKCNLSVARRRWYIPALCIAAGFALLAWYLINGGPPKIAGYKLFQVHEAYCLPYLLGFESIIQIGMIPANTGYERLFDYSGINACIYDSMGAPVVASTDWNPGPYDEDHRIRRESVTGGTVSWVEDLSALNRLNRDLEEVTAELTEENELIRQENEVRAERVTYETRNRLYNSIFSQLRPAAVRADSLLSGEDRTEEAFCRDLIRAALLSVYIKRMGNLLLLSDGARTLSSAELEMSVRESLDYVQLTGAVCELRTNGSGELPCALVTAAYALFEEVLEATDMEPQSLSVSISCEGGLAMAVETDRMLPDPAGYRCMAQLRAAGGEVTYRYEDETACVSLRSAFGEEAAV